MSDAIAIVGMACRYAGADSPVRLWENVLAKRREFRRLPPERLLIQDYYSSEREAPDKIYSTEAAILDGFEFDRRRFRIGVDTFQSTDIAHWLALDVATQAFEDAGFTRDSPAEESTGVVLGNTLTGEMSRANAMRLRWPYVRRVVAERLAREAWEPERTARFLDELEVQYKAPFPSINEETLAGSLSNTIAGRICNHLNLHGGGYTVDAACASSLLAVVNGCTSLRSGDLRVALVGGVDVSLDPFELVGFAKTGALTDQDMRVFDRDSNGFLPGEGCGFVVLMREQDAKAEGRPIHALIRGWGVSSDGEGGITRPEVGGQLRAIRRAYAKAGFDIDTVSYLEAHGTGTRVGDLTEMRALAQALESSAHLRVPVALGSIKANIGHTKAAAGVAGLIKAAMVVREGVLPPTTGCRAVHSELLHHRDKLRVLDHATLGPTDRPLRAGVSAFGFGGINTHLALEADGMRPRGSSSASLIAASAESQQSELLMLAGSDAASLRAQANRLLRLARKISYAELSDLAIDGLRRSPSGPWRAAILAGSPAELALRAEALSSWLGTGSALAEKLTWHDGVVFSNRGTLPRFGFLFPGQASPVRDEAKELARKFGGVRRLYDAWVLPPACDRDPLFVQAAISRSSLAGLEVLESLNVVADVAVGHSLGEIAALRWTGFVSSSDVPRLVAARAKAMSRSRRQGAMASVHADAPPVERLVKRLGREELVVAAYNGPHQTVVSGPTELLEEFLVAASAIGLEATKLDVLHAFHSPLFREASVALEADLASFSFGNGSRRPRPISSVTGLRLESSEDLRSHLARQLTSPVRFTEALHEAARSVDLLIEVGAGTTLTSICRSMGSAIPPAVSLDIGDGSLQGILATSGLAWVLGAPIRLEPLYRSRFSRPFDADRLPSFLCNPCESAPAPHATPVTEKRTAEEELRVRPHETKVEENVGRHAPLDRAVALETLRGLVAKKTALPAGSIGDEQSLLTELHLSSIAVGEIVVRASRQLGLPPPVSPTDYARASLREIVAALDEVQLRGGSSPSVPVTQLAGVDSWVRTFVVDWTERMRPNRGEPRTTVGSTGAWQFFGIRDGLTLELESALRNDGGAPGVLLHLSAGSPLGDVVELARAAKHVLRGGHERFAVVQDNGGAAGFAKSVHLESGGRATLVVDLPRSHPAATSFVLAELADMEGYREVRYDEAGRRYEPSLRRLRKGELIPSEVELGESDVLLVSGGGKGIAAECALSLGLATGAKLALVGRSRPEDDPVLSRNLERFAGAGIHFRYVSADVADSSSVREAVGLILDSLGPITAILHGAGINEPKLTSELEERDLQAMLAAKVDGLKNLLSAAGEDQLRLLLAFGSLIARTGMPGEAHYAFANERLALDVAAFQQRHHACHCLVVEWSVWSGVGMAERLGRVDALMRQGIAPLPADVAVSILGRLVDHRAPGSSVVVSGRFGPTTTLALDGPELPLARFLERPLLHYPEIELIADCTVSASTDPYVLDHVLDGELIFPGVMGIEAMAQAACALRPRDGLRLIEDVEFLRPLVVHESESLVLRTVALGHDDCVRVALRCSATDFALDHFRATFRFGNRTSLPRPTMGDRVRRDGKVPLDPSRALYGSILFQSGRFQRVLGYRDLTARACIAEIDTTEPAASWFSYGQPKALALGNPAVRDAVIHCVQACIPHRVVIPVGVRQIELLSSAVTGEARVHAWETKEHGGDLEYDIEVWRDGALAERWRGLKLYPAARRAPEDGWPISLLGPYVERRLEELRPLARVKVTIGRYGRSSQAESVAAFSGVTHRPDGKPLPVNGRCLSRAHAGDLTVSVLGRECVGCDIEPVATRSREDWQGLLGECGYSLAQAVAIDSGEGLDVASTRLWAVHESAKKAGLMTCPPIRLEASHEDGWTTFRSGRATIDTVAFRSSDDDTQYVIAVLASHP